MINDRTTTAVDLLNSGKTLEALELLEQLQAEDSSGVAGLYSQAIAQARLHQFSAAIQSLQELLAIAPTHHKAKSLMTELQVLMTQVDRPSRSNPTQPPLDTELEQRFPQVTFGSLVQLIGMSNMQIGAGTCIADHVWLNVCAPDSSVQLRIGQCTLVGRQSMISTGGYLEIGDYCLLAPRVYISNADHVYADINRPYIEQGFTGGRSLIIEENCWLGINSVITGGLTVGRGAVVAANSIIRQDVPPFCVVAGNPSRIVKLYNPLTQQWEQTRSEQEQQRLLDLRDRVGLPSREDYRELLRQNAQVRRIDPILAGHGISI